MTLYTIVLFFINIWRMVMDKHEELNGDSVQENRLCMALASFIGLSLLLDFSWITYLVRKFLLNTKLSCGEYLFEVPLHKFEE